MADKPFKIGTGERPRSPDGRFERDGATPPNPLEVEDSGARPQQWAPGVGQGSAAIRQQDIPWEGVVAPNVPFKLT